jgi:hypothetical protein
MTNNNKEYRVIIKKEAFRNIITHLLRFGNTVLQNTYEVLGLCIGRRSETNDLIVLNAIPITHGKEINISNDNKLLENINEVKEKYNSSELRVIGNYISHVNNGLSLKERDINNLLQFQNEDNPLGFCIVLDPKRIDQKDNFDFKIYTLYDFHQGINSEYHELDYEIEIPKSLDYFKWVQKFVEDYQKEDPILIKEIIELSEEKQKDLQEIPKIKEKISEDLFNFSNFKEANVELGNTVESIINQQIRRWGEELKEAALSGNEKLLKSIIQIKQNISRGMINYKNKFKEDLKDIFKIFEGSISNYIDIRNRDFTQLINNTDEKYNIISDSLIKSLKKQLSENYKDLEETLKKFGEMSENSKNQMKTIEERTQILNESIVKMPEQVNKNSEEIIVRLKEMEEKNSIEKLELLNNLDSKIEKLEKSFVENKNKIEDEVKKIKNL